eukprot:7390624-Prymnesium_polylepis.2
MSNRAEPGSSSVTYAACRDAPHCAVWGPAVAGTLIVLPHCTAPLAWLGSPAASLSQISNGDRFACPKSDRAYTCTSLTLPPAGTPTDSHAFAEITSVWQKFHPSELFVRPSMHMEAEKSYPG